jgi:hypothetical protein
MFRGIVVLVGGLAALCVGPMFAQDSILTRNYAQGVHAYFAGEYLKAGEQLTSLIKTGTTDPRVFYFRGLAYSRLGRGDDAAKDFQRGAALESKDFTKFYNASKALERVQGPVRLELENYRAEARAAAMAEVERLRKARYEAIRREESRVLRREEVPSPPEPGKTTEPAAEEPAAPAAEATTADPFAAKRPSEDTEPAKKPVAKEKPAAEPKPADKEKPVVNPKPADNETPAAEPKPADNDTPAPEEKKPPEPVEKDAESVDPFAN